MPRTRKLQPAIATAEAGVKEILATSVERTLEEAATYVNVAVFKLQEMFCDRLGNSEPSGWDTVPTEHEPLLEEFKRQMDAAATVKPHELPPVQETEIPIQTDEPVAGMTPYEGDGSSLATGIQQEVLDTEALNESANKAQDFLYQTEEEKQAQLAASVKLHGWAIYEQVGAEIDTAKIMELAQRNLASADEITGSRMTEVRQRRGMKSPEQLKAEIEAVQQRFLQQSQRRTQAWTQATSLKSSN